MGKNANDYGVYKGSIEAGTDQWVITEMPLTLAEPTVTQGVINNLSCAEGIVISGYLTQTQGEVFSFGRPGDRHG